MIKITIKIDSSCDMACVTDEKGQIMEGNFWDFHNGCHGHYHLDNFTSYISYANVLKKYHEANGEKVKIVKETYKYEYRKKKKSLCKI